MFTAITSSGTTVSAEVAALVGGDYFCPECRAAVHVRAGLVKVEHFAHASNSSCTYAGEGILHLQMKQQIFYYLKHVIGSKVKAIELEKRLDGVRPDVYIQGMKSEIAIEVQASVLTPEQILSRTTRYCERGIYVIWVLPYDHERFLMKNQKTGMTDKSFRIKEYERIIAQMGFKSMILWDVKRDWNEGFVVFEIQDAYSEGADFYDKNRGEHVSYSSRKLKTIKVIEKVRANVAISELAFKRIGSFQMSYASYDLPERMIGYYNWPKSKGQQSKY